MPSREAIQFHAPLRDVRLGRALPQEFTAHVHAAECAGYQRGVVEGERALSEQLLRQRAELLDMHNGAIKALQEAVPQVVRQTEDAMISLALEIAQKLVGDLPITRDMVAATVREALEQVEDTTEFNVLLHADDLELLGPDAAHVVGHAGSHKMRITASRDVTRGGCMVQTRFGIIDARRETKLARVAETLGLS